MSDNTEKLAKLESKTDSLLSKVVASRFTWAIVGGALVAAVILGAKLC